MNEYLTEKGIQPIRIPTPFAVGDVFSYLITHEKNILIDCGHYSEESLYLIEEALDRNGLKLNEIDEIWLTHGHPDHFGLAARLAAVSGAIVKGHSKEKSNFNGNIDRERFVDFFREQHIPHHYIYYMIKQLEWLQQFQKAIKPEWVGEGEVLTTGNMKFIVKHTPGHTPGHLCYYSSDGEITFGGDLLLEHVSTNALINFDPDTGQRNKSLLQYRDSLNWISRQTGVVLPGHGNIIRAPRKAANHHLSEHEKRYLQIRNLLRKQPKSLFEVGRALFPDALNEESVFLVISEVLGYLDWGHQDGRVKQTMINEQPKYIVADD